jgi:hypothetical protein
MQQNNTMPKTAVIMPAYNSGATIEASVRSILNQTVSNLVLIVVNDGSTDDTAAVLERLRAEDERLIPMTVPNGGPAKARNFALAALPEDAEYIMFADSDDLLERDALEYALTKGQGADLVLMGFSIKNTDGSTASYFEPEQHLDPSTLGENLGRLYKANLLNQVWAKLFSAERVKSGQIGFPDYRWGEDRLFIFDCLEHARSVAVLPECKYNYIMHPGQSLISSYYDKKFDVCLEADARAQQLCRKFGAEDDADFRYMFVKSVFSCLTTLFSPGCRLTCAEKREVIRSIITNDQLRERSRKPFGGAAVKLLCAVMRSGSISLNYVAFRFVAWAGRVTPRFFTKLKHRK